MRPYRGLVMLILLIAVSTAASVAVLQAVRGVVERTGTALVRRAVVRASDRVAAQSADELDRQVGCRAVDERPLPYRICVAVSRTATDSVRVVVVIEPRNALVAADSMVFHAGRAGS